MLITLQGLTIDRDREGNIYCRSNSDAVSCPLEVIGWQTPHLHSLSPDIVRSKGRIDTKTIKVRHSQVGRGRSSRLVLSAWRVWAGLGEVFVGSAFLCFTPCDLCLGGVQIRPW